MSWRVRRGSVSQEPEGLQDFGLGGQAASLLLLPVCYKGATRPVEFKRSGGSPVPDRGAFWPHCGKGVNGVLCWESTTSRSASQCCSLLVQPTFCLHTWSLVLSATLQGKHYPNFWAKETEAQGSLETRLRPHSDKARIVPSSVLLQSPHSFHYMTFLY